MADVINVNDFKPGMTFLKNDNIFIVLEASHAKSGRGQAHVRVKSKNISTKNIITFTFVGGEKVEKAFVTKREMQFLYYDEKEAHFMDQETFEQFALNLEDLENEKKFLAENQKIIVSFYQDQILEIELPKNIALKVSETADAVRGDTVSKATKKAILESGLEVDVPQFIAEGDEIIISSATGKYVSKK